MSAWRSVEARVLGTRVAAALAVLAAWQVLPSAGVLDPFAVVPLSDAAAASVSLVVSGEALDDLGATTLKILISFAIAAVSGLAAGFALWRFPMPYRLLRPYLTSYYALPLIVFYPVLVAIFGLSAVPGILIAAGWAVVAVVISTVTGLDSMRPVYRKVVRIYGLSPSQAMRRVYVPAAAPLIFGGLQLAASYSIIGVIATEFVLAPRGGLGYLVAFYYNNFDAERMYGVVLLIVVLATVATTLLRGLEGRFHAR